MKGMTAGMTATTAMRFACAVLGLVLAFVWPAAASAFVPPPMRDAVTDTAGRLTDADDRALEERITAYRNRTGNEIAVLVIGSLDGASIEDVAYKTFNEWGIGKKGLDNGVLLVIAPTERKTRIETGKGIGDRLTDIDCGIILRERVGPLLKEDRFREAIDAALDAIEAALDGRPEPPLPTSLTKTPLVRGAFVIDAAGALDEATLASLEADAAKEGRYWKTFAVIVVPDPPAPSSELAKRINDARKGVPGLFHEYVNFYFVGAKSRRVALFHSPGVNEELRERRLSAPVQAAPTLEAGIRALAASEIAERRADEARMREASRRAEEKQRSDGKVVFIILAAVAAFILGGIGLFAYAVFRTGRGGSSGRSYSRGSSSSSSSSPYEAPSYGSSSSDASYGGSSSSVDTSYSGGGGSSGGGGASDSY